MLRPALAIALALAVPGCGAITALDDAARPLEIFELRTPDVPTATRGRRDLEIVVEEPIASGALATERIMVRPGPLQAQYLPGVRWADPAPAMLQTLMVRSLTASGAFRSVGRRPIGTAGDYAVLSELTDFQADAPAEAPGATVEVGLTVRLVRERDASVVALRSFATAEPVPDTSPARIAAAFDRATARLLAGIVAWIATTAR